MKHTGASRSETISQILISWEILKSQISDLNPGTVLFSLAQNREEVKLNFVNPKAKKYCMNAEYV